MVFPMCFLQIYPSHLMSILCQSSVNCQGNQVPGLATLQLVVRSFLWGAIRTQHRDHEVPVSNHNRTRVARVSAGPEIFYGLAER